MKKLLYIVICLALLQSCRTRKDILLLQNIENVDINKNNLGYINEYKLEPGDELSINISARDKELLTPFISNTSQYNGGNSGNSYGGITYNIEEDNTINFPTLGKVKIGGLTREEAINKLTNLLSDYLKDPIVNIRVNNFKVTVMGSSGGKIVNVNGQSTNILEVLAESGEINKGVDIDDILLIRKENGLRKKYTINLKDANVFNEPFYFVKQNDIIYIKPSWESTLSFNSTPFSAISTVLSLGLTIYALFIK